MATDLALSKRAPSLPRAVELLDLYRQATAWKEPVRVATTANLTQTAEQTIDGVAVKVGDRVLCKDQSTAAQDGIWIVRHTAWLRAPDCDADRPGKLVCGTKVAVQEGTANAGTTWKLETTGTIVVGTTSLTWTADGGSGGGAAEDVTFTPAQGIAATDVQAAIEETVTDAAATYATLAGTSNLIDTAGDSLTGTADNTLGKLAKGTAFQVRRMNSAANAEEWATPNLALARPKTGSTVYPGWPNAAAGIVAASAAITAATDRFIPFEVRRPITVTDVSCSTTTTAVGKFAWVGIVALNTDMQPSGAVTQQSSVTLDATGTHTWNPTTLTLDAGLYAVCWNHDSTATFRYWYFAVPGMAFNDGAYTTIGVVSLEKARAAAAFSGTPTWDTPVTVAMSTAAFSIYTPWMMKWTPT